ncbi:MAG: hypothetical protein ACLR0U_07710 [Enterocloster clostridioformis]
MRKKTIDTIPVLTDEIKNILNTFSRSRTMPASLTNRASIALMASEGLTNQEISARLNMHYNSVGAGAAASLKHFPISGKSRNPHQTNFLTKSGRFFGQAPSGLSLYFYTGADHEDH